jgi:hypothetical protein
MNKKFSFKSALDDTEISHQPCRFDGECDFEVDWCNFMNASDASYYSWSRGRNGTQTLGTGPPFDHVKSSNY